MQEVLPADHAGVIRRALLEDVGSGDVTTTLVVPEAARARAKLVARQEGVVAGLDVAAEVFREVDPDVAFERLAEEGQKVLPGQDLAEVEGFARSILMAERTALNFLGRMSGIATLTRRFVDAVAGTSARILDTRKTAPGLRSLDKLAVLRGGGANHRLGLYDMVLIKDNHVDIVGSLAEAVRRVSSSRNNLEIEVEARSLEDVRTALQAGVRRILLDNMGVATMKQAVDIARGRARLEASGNVTLSNVRQIAETGVDDISIGGLTHSAPVLDISLELVRASASRGGGHGGGGL